MRNTSWVVATATVVLGFGFGHMGCYTSGTPGGNGAGGAPQGGAAQGGQANGGSGADAGTSENDSGTQTDSGSPTTDTCSNDADCEERNDDKLICRQDLKICVQCLDNNQCPNLGDAGSAASSNRYCYLDACLNFTACRKTSDCSGKGICDTATERCYQCLSNADCQVQTGVEGPICFLHRCRASCNSDLGCKTSACDLTNSVCTDECSTNSDCHPGYRCDVDSSKCVAAG